MRVAALASTLVVLLLGTTEARADPGPHPMFTEQQQSIAELDQLTGADFEIGYINRIVPHHQGAIESAQMVVDTAPHQEVRDQAAIIIQMQQEEIALLTGYLRDTYGQELDPDERFMMSPEMMQQFESADPAMAESMFLGMMREHHQSANQLGNLVLERDVAPALRDQASKMVEDQTSEQQLFATFLQSWYGIQAPQPTGDMQAGMELAMAGQSTMPGMPNTGDGGTQQPNATATSWGAIAAVAGALLLLGAGAYWLLRRSPAR